MTTKFFREIEFCYEMLNMPYSKFRELPRWEKILINTYLDTKLIKQQREDDYWEQKKHRDSLEEKGWTKEGGAWLLNL